MKYPEKKWGRKIVANNKISSQQLVTISKESVIMFIFIHAVDLGETLNREGKLLHSFGASISGQKFTLAIPQLFEKWTKSTCDSI